MDTIITSSNSTPPEKPRWQLIALSECGPRVENQDNYLTIDTQGEYQHLENQKITTGTIKNWQKDHIRLAVADGMGGHNNGRQAAEALIKHLKTLPFQDNCQQLKQQIIKIHQQLFKQYHQGTKTPGSTLVMADINKYGKATIINIGDSRAYIYHQQTWTQLSKDHTQQEFAWRDAEISDKQYHKGLLQNSNQIVQAIGFGSSGIIPNSEGNKTYQHHSDLRIEIEKDIFQYQLKQYDVLMLASDGIWSGKQAFVPTNIAKTELQTYSQKQIADSELTATDNLTLVACKRI